MKSRAYDLFIMRWTLHDNEDELRKSFSERDFSPRWWVSSVFFCLEFNVDNKVLTIACLLVSPPLAVGRRHVPRSAASSGSGQTGQSAQLSAGWRSCLLTSTLCFLIQVFSDIFRLLSSNDCMDFCIIWLSLWHVEADGTAFYAWSTVWAAHTARKDAEASVSGVYVYLAGLQNK